MKVWDLSPNLQKKVLAIGLRFPYIISRTAWGRSSAGRALDWQSRGQGFDPPRLHPSEPPPSDYSEGVLLFGLMAQWLAQGTHNPWVAGSNPAGPTKRPAQRPFGSLSFFARHDVAACAAQLHARGARNVLVSMAGDGALLLDETGACRRAPAPAGRVKNSVGAGDSMVAGFLAGWLQTGDFAHALRLGTAAGSAAAFSDGLPARADIEALLAQPGPAR